MTHNASLLIVRAAQGIIALVDLILLSYSVHRWTNGYASWYHSGSSELTFFLFVAVWTLLALAYLVFAPVHYRDIAHIYAIATVEFLTLVFWFAAWVASATYLGRVGIEGWTPAQVATAATVFGAINWLLFTFTFFLAARHVYNDRRGRPSHAHKHGGPGLRVDAAA